MTKIKKTIGKIPYSLGVRLTKPNDKTSEKRVYAYAQRDETIGTAALALAAAVAAATRVAAMLTQGTLRRSLKKGQGACICPLPHKHIRKFAFPLG